MIQIELTLTPYEASIPEIYIAKACNKANIGVNNITNTQIIHKSIDARGRSISVNLTLQLFTENEQPENIKQKYKYQDVSKAKECVVVGSGPAGLFAALRLIELGIKPIVIERGNDVHQRRRDIALLNTQHLLNPDSNYCYGEGGAGTFSDGKLYTRSTKRGDNTRILEIFHIHGADSSILYESRPHIGTDRLPRIIESMRQTIINCGGKVMFKTKLTGITINNHTVTSIDTTNGQIPVQALILATGHSAEDVYQILASAGIKLEPKGFAMGVRVEHPRQIIDNIRYHGANTEYLPAATYNVAVQSNQRGVYSFCMCPGGQIVPSSTAPGRTLVNGMSAAARNNKWSNAAIVVEIRPEDIPNINTNNPMAGFIWQQQIEQMTFINGRSNQTAPAQRITDFVKGQISSSLPPSSYVPGIISSPVHFWLPDFIAKRLQDGFKQINNKMNGFLTEQALVIASETRTSSPIRIVRLPNTMNCVGITNLFACGEGAGYAGGIVSSAIDGEKAAEAVALL